MAKVAKAIIKTFLRSLGYEVSRIEKVGVDPFSDMRRFLGRSDPLIVFDVGANVGQSAQQFRKHFPRAVIHSFEPSPSVFHQLRTNVAPDPNMRAWNCGLGASENPQLLLENDQSVMSSFLRLGEDGWGQTVKETAVELRTVDHFCYDHHIRGIDVLKSDTQGYDFEVLKGAGQMLRTGTIKLVYLELNFANIYVGQGSFGQQYDFLSELGFRLVSFYQMFRLNELAGWTDALFIHRSLLENQESKSEAASH